MLGITLVLALASLVSGQTNTCGQPEIANKPGNSRVIGGTNVIHGSFPWTVQLKSLGSHSCGASIIDENYVLTAAHCFNKSPYASYWKVHAGSYNRDFTDSSEQSVGVSQIIKHSKYSKYSLDYDIALLKLKTPLKFGKYVKPVCLPDSNEQVSVGQTCYVTGWGETFNTGYSGVMKQAYIPIVSYNTCSYGHPGMITSNMVCAGEQSSTNRPCFGDSGGPLACYTKGRWVQFGVVSWGDQYCSSKYKPGVFSYTYSFNAWIKQNMV